MVSHYQDEPQGTYPSKSMNQSCKRFYGFEWFQNLKMFNSAVSLLFGMLDYHCSPDARSIFSKAATWKRFSHRLRNEITASRPCSVEWPHKSYTSMLCLNYLSKAN